MGDGPPRTPRSPNALRRTVKDRADNAIIVDLLRNDMGRVARAGCGDPGATCSTSERYETVWQLTSTVSAQARCDMASWICSARLFPCGSVTGAPKVETTS